MSTSQSKNQGGLKLNDKMQPTDAKTKMTKMLLTVWEKTESRLPKNALMSKSKATWNKWKRQSHQTNRRYKDKQNGNLRSIKRSNWNKDYHGHRGTLNNDKKPNRQEDITTLMCSCPNSKDEKHMKQYLTEMKGKVHKLTAIVGDSKPPFCTIDRTVTRKLGRIQNKLNESSTNRIQSTFIKYSTNEHQNVH